MTEFVTYLVLGLVFGAAYAIAASGLVITYATSNVFNMAHGAVGMLMAFAYWQLDVAWALPTWLALVLVVGVIAPLTGVVLEAVLMRRLVDASVTVSLTVTVGLLVFLIGLAQTFWPPAGRRIEPFFAGGGVQIAGVFVTGHQILTFALALAVAGAIWLLFDRTRTGIAMRAIVDNRTLLALHGARPRRLGALSWAIGSSLAGLAGILLASDIGLDYTTLAFLVINAYAAAVVGRLVDLRWTFIGAVALGLAQNFFQLGVQWLPESVTASFGDIVSGLRASLPTILLFAVMLLLPQEKLRVGSIRGASLVRLPSRRQVVVWGSVLVAVVAVITEVVTVGTTISLGRSLAFATIMLSLVVLTGYGGDVSLSQMTFVGVGAIVVAKYFVTVTPVALVAAGLAAGLVGILVGLPALRLRGVYLALGTLAFALAMDKLFFQSDWAFKLGGAMQVERGSILGASLGSERAFAIVTAVGFVGLGWLTLEIRRGRFGRLLLATRDSPAACATLGLSITRTRVAVFGVSAAMAGVAGGLFAGMSVSVGATSFEMFQSLPLVLLAVVGGITSVTGALLGGLFLGLGPIIQDALPAEGTIFLLTGLAAIAIGRNPNGVAGELFDAGAKLYRRTGTTVPEEPGGSGASAETAREVSVVGAP